MYIGLKQGFQNFFFKRPSKDKLKKLWTPLTRLLKKIPLKTPKIFFFAFHHQV